MPHEPGGWLLFFAEGFVKTKIAIACQGGGAERRLRRVHCEPCLRPESIGTLRL